MWISKIDFEELTGKASKLDAIVASILKANVSMKADDVTPEFIQEGLQASDNKSDNADEALSTRITELETEVQTLTETVTTLTTERDNLQTENAELRELPGAESVTADKPAAELSAIVTDDLLDFANKNKGNTAAIAAKMVETGFYKK